VSRVLAKEIAIIVGALLGIALVLGLLLELLGVLFLSPGGPGCYSWNGQRDLDVAASVIAADTGVSVVGDNRYDCDSSSAPPIIEIRYGVAMREQFEAKLEKLTYCRASGTADTWACSPRGRLVSIHVYTDGVAGVSLPA
jgi:hypothetical protein